MLIGGLRSKHRRWWRKVSNRFARRRWAAAAAVFTGLFGVASVVVIDSGVLGSRVVGVIIALLAGALGACWILRKPIPQPPVPILPRIPDDSEQDYRATCPVRRDQVQYIIDRCQLQFPDHAIDPARDLAGFEANRYSMITLTDWNAKVHGFVDFYHLKPEALNRIVTGKALVEDELPHSVVPHPEARTLRALYLPTISVFDPEQNNSLLSGIKAHLLVWAAASFLAEYQFQGIDLLDLFAFADSEEGGRLLSDLDFRVVQEATNPLGLTLYKRQVSRGDLLALATRFDMHRFCSRRCKLDFQIGA